MVVISSGVFVIVGGAVRAEGEGLKQRLITEYAPAAQQLEQFYTHLQMTERQTRGDKNRVYRYRSNGPLFRIDRIDPEGRIIRAAVNTPQWRFQVSRNDSGAFFLTTANSEGYESMEGLLRSNVKLPFAPYCIIDQSVVDFLSAPECKVSKVTEVTRAGKRLVQVFWERAVPLQARQFSGWFLFARDEFWVLLEYEFGGQRDRCSIHYGEKVDGIPLVKRVEYWRDVGGKRMAQYETEATDVKLGPAAEEDFTTAAFGLPEIQATGERTRPWLLPLGVLGLIASAILAFLARRSMPGSLIDTAARDPTH
jgi:hypothetical protein